MDLSRKWTSCSIRFEGRCPHRTHGSFDPDAKHTKQYDKRHVSQSTANLASRLHNTMPHLCWKQRQQQRKKRPNNEQTTAESATPTTNKHTCEECSFLGAATVSRLVSMLAQHWLDVVYVCMSVCTYRPQAVAQSSHNPPPQNLQDNKVLHPPHTTSPQSSH